MNHLKYILFLILFHNVAFAQNYNLEEAIIEMERVYKDTYNANLGIKTCKTVLEQVPRNSKEYLEATFYLGDWYIINRDKKGIETLLQTLKVNIENSNDAKKNKTASIYYLYLNSRYNSEITYNTEKAVIQGMAAFYMAKGKPKILAKVTPQAALSLTEVAQYGTAQDILKIYEVSAKLNRGSQMEKCKYFLTLGQVYMRAENWTKSTMFLEKAYNAISPIAKEYPYLHRKCLLKLAEDGTYFRGSKKAISTLENLSNDNRNYEYWDRLAIALYHEKIYDEGLDAAQKALVGLTNNFSSLDVMINPTVDADFLDTEKVTNNLYVKAMILRHKGTEAAKNGDTPKAIYFYKKSLETIQLGVDIYNRLANEMIGFGIASFIANEEIDALMGVIIHTSYDLYQVEQTEANFDQLFYAMEQRRSLSILQQTTKSPIPEELFPKFEAYFNRIEYYETIFMIGDGASFQKLGELIDLSFEYETFLKSLKQQNNKLRLTQKDFKYTSTKELQASLDENTIFIQYSVVRRHIYAIKITNNSVSAELLYKRNKMIEHSIYAYLNLIRNPLLVQQENRGKFINQSKVYYDILIKPFENDIKQKTRLIISPERELLFLPYELLLKTNENKPFHELDFLIKSYEINYRYSATLHQKTHQRPAIKNYSTLAFAPIFKDGSGTAKNDRSLNAFNADKYGSMNKKKFVHLPNSKREVEQINEIIGTKGETIILLGDQATKDNLQKHIKNNSFHFVHIATHSMVNYDDPRLSAIACFQYNGGENLYLSSEINKEKLRADLVILSSCESGVGRIIEGEGIIGLNRSFIISGARNVMFSLWKVDDKNSSELMINFYKYYMLSEDYTIALRQTKLKMLEDEIMANPRFWAAFVLIGE